MSRQSNNGLLVAGKLALGTGLLVLVALLIVGVWPEDEPHGFMDPAGAQSGETAAAQTSQPPSLTAFEQATQASAVLGLETTSDPVKLYAEPVPGAALLDSLPQHDDLGILTTFYALNERVDEMGRRWYEVQIPLPPNGRTAWIKAEDVSTFEIPYRLEVHLEDFRLDVRERGQIVASYPIGLGRAETPTPLGEYHVTEKIRPPSTDGVYGVLAIGVSAFSEQLTDWPGGGQVGIHGTNDPEGSIGRRASHGCIRLRNDDILDLTHFAPLGTPVLIAQ